MTEKQFCDESDSLLYAAALFVNQRSAGFPLGADLHTALVCIDTAAINAMREAEERSQ